MTSIVTAAYLATNVLLTSGDMALTNCNQHFARELYTVRNACVVEREITCPACGNVATQRVDITDVYSHYKRLQASDLRLNQSIVEFSVRENNKLLDDIARLKGEVSRLNAESLHLARKVGRDMYRDGYTNALMTVVKALRNPGKTCILCRRYSSGETRLMASLALAFEKAAQGSGGGDGAHDRD